MKFNSASKVFRRELHSLFFSPIAYIIMTLFLVTTGWFFFSTFFIAARVDLRDYFSLLPMILTFVIPAMTMRSFSEEYRSGSYEILVTLPITRLEIVIGKYLSSLVMILIMIAPTLIYPFFVGVTGDLDWGPVIGGYVGAVFLASAFCAIGIYASSLTHNQIVAFIIAVAVNFFLVLVDKMLILLPGFLTGFLQYLGADYHFQSIAKGVIDSRDLIYFVSVTYVALHLTYLVQREKR
ncbi:ABC transporter permease subunit [Spirochaeta cellobiosiphila]|uniref:ABC transporter permease subunit n=1 Tax=Spirochaeta cellobiosiphila TaxID=504483 RepID=UPI000415A3DC|nr:ABC transporter permease subunit [Spirochaeta cellobiosiphila]